MTPDCFSAILKYVFDACDAVAFLSVTEPVSNLRQFEIVGMLKMALCLPEFSKQKAWIQKAQEVQILIAKRTSHGKVHLTFLSR